MVRTPGYRLHRPSGRAVVTLNGKDHYIGVHGSAESKAAYKRLIAEYTSSGKRLCYGRWAKSVVGCHSVVHWEPAHPTQ